MVANQAGIGTVVTEAQHVQGSVAPVESQGFQVQRLDGHPTRPAFLPTAAQMCPRRPFSGANMGARQVRASVTPG